MTTIGLALGQQRQLFRYNRSVPDAQMYAEMLRLEEHTVARRAAEMEAAAPDFAGRTELVDALQAMLARERDDPGPSAVFLAERATYEQFRFVVGQFAVDGLTESQSFLPVVQRLPYRAAMAVFRVLVDEFGCGNVDQAHSQLYRNMLRELDLPTDLDSHLAGTGEETFAFVNLFYWSAARAGTPEYFLGGLAYLEASILYAFQPFADGCRRLGIDGSYYTEHLHIDNFHSKELLIAIREMESAVGVDLRKVWAGAQLTSTIVGEAVDAAVRRAGDAT